MKHHRVRQIAVVLAASMFLLACTESDDEASPAEDTASESSQPSPAAELDYAGLGLWDDGPCDDTRAPLNIGLMTIFESPVLSLRPLATALEASAAAFNARGGANGACIEVVTCDDGGSVDQAVDCVEQLDEAGVVATVNDTGSVGAAEVSAAMAAAGIPRVASTVGNADAGDQNAYPLDASGTGVTFLVPQALIDEGASSIGLVRVNLPAAGALVGILQDIYDGSAEIVADLPVAAGTTDYSQFILAADDAGADGISLALGDQEALQVLRAAEQLSTDLLLGAGSYPHAVTADLGAIAEQIVFVSPMVPATVDLPVYEAARSDLAASGEEELQPENLKASVLRSWIGLYALLAMVRDNGMTEFTRDGITDMLQTATDVPMLGMYGDATWTPNFNHPGLFQRSGIDAWSVYRWDPAAAAPDGLEGNYVETSTIGFDAVLCGSPLGGPEPC